MNKANASQQVDASGLWFRFQLYPDQININYAILHYTYLKQSYFAA